MNSIPVGKCPTEGSGPIFANKQSQVAVWRKTRRPEEKLRLWYMNILLKLNTKNWNSIQPSLLLLSEKFWLWTIFSTMSSASMRVSSTQLGCLSTVSFFLLLLGETNTSWDKVHIWNRLNILWFSYCQQDTEVKAPIGSELSFISFIDLLYVFMSMWAWDV